MLILGLTALILLLAGLGCRHVAKRARRAGRSRIRRRRNLAYQTLWEQVFAQRRTRRLTGPAAEPHDISSAS
jgi:hypothetical protein